MSYEELVNRSKAEAAKAKDVIEDVIATYTGLDGKYDWLHGDDAGGEYIYRLGSTCPADFDFQHLYWWLERAIGRQLYETTIPSAEKLYALLKAGEYSEELTFDFNDADNTAFFIPHPALKIVGLTDQNRNYLLIWSTAHDFHIRRYWDEWSDEHDYEPVTSTAEAVGAAERLAEYSDVGHNYYPHRPSLAWFKEQKFKPRYRDGRDLGYIISTSYNPVGTPRAVDPYSLIELKIAILDMECAITELEED
jgi:hypothetical protein